MAITKAASRLGPIAERVFDNQYAQEQLRVGVESLRAARARAAKRRVKATQDQKVRERLRQGAASIAEAAKAFESGRQEPEKSVGKLKWILTGLAAGGAAVAVASSEELQAKLLEAIGGDAGST